MVWLPGGARLIPESLTRNNWRGALSLLAVAIAATGLGSAALASAENGFVLAAIFSLAVGMILALATSKAVASGQRRLRRLRLALRAISKGDLSQRVALEGMGDLRAEAGAVNDLAVAFSESIQRMRLLTDHLQRLPEEITQALAEIDQGADNQEAAVEETASLLANINTSIRGINSEVDQLARRNEETASSITEMGTAVEQVARNAVELQRTVEGSTSAVNQMGAQIRRVAENSDGVQRVAEETASSIAEMDQAIREVGDHVQGASALTEKVRESAEGGTRAVGATIDGIARIREMTLEARSALQGLDDRIAQIGEIATVIGGISDETNLLSLNAAIIAAQAGEHGKAFVVVAEQVKTLARRTTASTKQIEELIRAVQEESENAVRAMGAGIEAVEEGVDRSRVAGEALEAISISSRDASGRVGEIARATEEQTRNSRHVADSAQQTSDHIQQISSAMNEQSLAADQLLKNSTTAVEMCSQVTRATEEQRETGRYIATNAAAITEMIHSIQRETAAHADTSTGLSNTVGSILDNARKSCERIPEVARIIAQLQEQAEAVGAEIARFEAVMPTESAGRDD
jgi:methyl-accepting chemotaxis protein